MKVRPAGEDPKDRTTGHHHLIIDDKAPAEGTVVPADETHIHYGKGQTEAKVKLSEGEHTLTMQLADGAHLSYGPKLSTSIKVKVVKSQGERKVFAFLHGYDAHMPYMGEAVDREALGLPPDRPATGHGKTCRGEGEVTVRYESEGDRIRLTVEDQGPGIPKDLIDRVCDPFFSTKPEGQGTGLGLSVTLGIVQAHDGRLDIHSTPGHGTDPVHQRVLRGRQPGSFLLPQQLVTLRRCQDVEVPDIALR